MSGSSELVVVIEGIRAVEGEATLLGHAHVFGVLHHAWLVRVYQRDGLQVPVDDPHHRLEDLHYLSGDGGPFETITVRGFPGEYALVISPGVR